MTKYFSDSTKGFYDPDLYGPRTIDVPDPAWVNPDPEGNPDAQAPLIAVPNPDCRMPADVVEVSDVLYAEMLGSGADLESDPTTGLPRIKVKIVTIDDIRNAVFPEMRLLRKDILDALTGIGFRAMLQQQTASDPAVASAAAQTAADASAAQQTLLDFTVDPRVLAVTVDQGQTVLRDTILTIFREQKAAAPASVAPAFEEVPL
jgi:hypothetical protein